MMVQTREEFDESNITYTRYQFFQNKNNKFHFQDKDQVFLLSCQKGNQT
jgi:hypothetical protein